MTEVAFATVSARRGRRSRRASNARRPAPARESAPSEAPRPVTTHWGSPSRLRIHHVVAHPQRDYVTTAATTRWSA